MAKVIKVWFGKYGRVTKELFENGEIHKYRYNGSLWYDCRFIDIIKPDGTKFTYEFDSNGEIISCESNCGFEYMDGKIIKYNKNNKREYMEIKIPYIDTPRIIKLRPDDCEHGKIIKGSSQSLDEILYNDDYDDCIDCEKDDCANLSYNEYDHTQRASICDKYGNIIININLY